MNNAETLKAAKLALQKTENGTMSWASGSGSSYQVDFNKSSIVVWDDKHAYFFAILNARGETVGKIGESRVRKSETLSLLIKLYTMAEESYLKTDITLRDVFENLE